MNFGAQVTGDVAGIVILHVPRDMGEDVPNAFAASIFVDRAFDLVTRGRCTPYKARRKSISIGHGSTGAQKLTGSE